MKWTQRDKGRWTSELGPVLGVVWTVEVNNRGHYVTVNDVPKSDPTETLPYINVHETLREAQLYCELLEYKALSRIATNAAPASVESGWLIERPSGSLDMGRPIWLRAMGPAWMWTDDASKALRFARECDALAAAQLLGVDRCTITEHQFE